MMAEVIFRCKCGWEDGVTVTKRMIETSKKTDQIERLCPKCGKSARPISMPKTKDDKWYSSRKSDD